MIIIGQISIQSLTTHCDFFQFTLTPLAKIFVWNKRGAKAERDWNKPIDSLYVRQALSGKKVI